MLKIDLDDGIQINTHNDYIGKLIEKNKSYYEKEILNHFIDYFPSNSIIYDIGANIGNHSLFFSKYLKAKKVYAFEPVKETYDLLMKNKAENNYDNIYAFDYALGEGEDTASIEYNNDNLGACKVHLSTEGEVHIKSVDKLDIAPPDFVKIDVEGYELNVLKGMENTLSNHFPVIWVESFTENFLELDEFLDNLGYVLIDKWLDNHIYTHPNKRHDLSDIFKFIKTKALKRNAHKINDLNKKYKKRESYIEKLNQEIENYKREINDKENEKQKLKEDLVDQDKLIRELDRYREERKENLQTINDLKIEVAKSEEQAICIQELQRKSEDLEKVNKKMEKDNDQLLDELQALRSEVKSLKISETKLKEDLQNQIASKAEILNEEEEFILKLEEQLINQQEYENKYAVIKQELKKLQNDFSKLNKRYNSLKKSKLGKVTLKYWNLRDRLRK